MNKKGVAIGIGLIGVVLAIFAVALFANQAKEVKAEDIITGTIIGCLPYGYGSMCNADTHCVEPTYCRHDPVWDNTPGDHACYCMLDDGTLASELIIPPPLEGVIYCGSFGTWGQCSAGCPLGSTCTWMSPDNSCRCISGPQGE